MRYNRRARLNTSQVRDVRGARIGGRGAALGGGGLGIVGLLVYLLVVYVGGSGGSAASVLGQLAEPGGPATADNSQLRQECRNGADANQHLECAVVADINSIQNFWAAELPRLGTRYVPVKTVWFSGRANTGCGPATSGTGPFYCPADKLVYIDLSFYNELKSQFGARGGLFVDAYVLAHEYGHHVQDLLGTEAKVRTREGPNSDSVRLELQADCYAGVWARHATQPEQGRPALITQVTKDDFARALDTAGRIGDDYIQTHLGSGRVDRSQFTHGTSAQREKWLTTGYRTGDPRACDTFGTNQLG
ncbi:MAG TPA: neutral zinc metallopeptidase [Jatrophihabitans sp.]|nr:neutral zinc metallopeptidase [Jatrophihabitans sp.]